MDYMCIKHYSPAWFTRTNMVAHFVAQYTLWKHKHCSEIFKGARVGRHNWRTSLGGCNFRLIALQRKKGESDAHLDGLIYLLHFRSICQKCLHASGNGTGNSYSYEDQIHGQERDVDAKNVSLAERMKVVTVGEKE